MSKTNRYAGSAFADDSQVDRFAAGFREALVTDQRTRVAEMIQFPIDVSLRGRRDGRVTIQNKSALIKLYDQIFTRRFLDRIRAASPTHMFCKYSGVMLGRGEVWIAPIESRSADGGKVTVPRVVAINNGE